MLRRYLDENKLDYSLSVDTTLNTTLAIVDTDSDGSANYVIYTHHTADVSIVNDELPQSLPDDIRVIHFASYSTVVEPTAASLITFAARETNNKIISYDLNLRTAIEPDLTRWRNAYASIAASTTIIKASDEDIETLLGKNREEQFVDDCFSHGVELVFITRGPNGSSGFKPGGQRVNCDGVAVDVVDYVISLRITVLECTQST